MLQIVRNALCQMPCSSPSRAPVNPQDDRDSLEDFDALEPMAPLDTVECIAAAHVNDECDIADFLTDDDEDDVVIFLTEGILDILFYDAGGSEKVHGGSVAGCGRNQNGDYDAAVARIKTFYFGLNGSPPQVNESTFSRRFGIHREGFNKIYSALLTRPEFVQKTDAVGKKERNPSSSAYHRSLASFARRCGLRRC